jgi:RecA-family ATPase
MNHDPEALRFDLDADPEPIQWIVEGLLEAGTICVLSGDTSVGKSQLALALAAAMLTGGTWLGHDVPQGRVLYIDGENYRRIVHDRLPSMARLKGLRQLS